MATFRIDKVKLLEQFFGAAGLTYYRITSKELEHGGKEYETIDINTEEAEATGALGLPIIGNVVIGASEQEIRDGKGMTLESCILTVNLEKNIVKTAVAGRNGTIKEFIANGDYQVGIQGILVEQSSSNNNLVPSKKAPEKLIRQLKALCDLKQALVVQSKLLSWLGIHNIVVEGKNIPQQVGFVNIQPFELRCISDDPLEIETLKQENQF